MKYIIIFGGVVGVVFTDKIFFIDISKGYDNLTFIESNIRCPMPYTFKAVLISDKMREEILIHGYIRHFFENMTKLSDDLIKLMASFLDRFSYAQLFHSYDSRHWKICLDDLVSSIN